MPQAEEGAEPDVAVEGLFENDPVTVSRVNILVALAARLQKLHIGTVVTYATMAGFLGVVGMASALAWTGQGGEVGPFVQALQPVLLPLLGAIAGYAFGHQMAAHHQPEE